MNETGQAAIPPATSAKKAKPLAAAFAATDYVGLLRLSV